MSLSDYHYEVSHCHRCSYCKFVPFQVMKSRRFFQGCPSIAFRNFHSYAAGGRVILALSIIEGRLKEYTETLAKIVFECTMCGACQVQCRTYNYNLNPIEVMQELRTHLIENGQLIPEHLMVIDGLKREDNVFGEPKADRNRWLEGLEIKDINTEKADVLFHPGCRTCYDEEFWDNARAAVTILQNAGVDVGTAGKEDSCCGGRAYEMGYKGELVNYAEALAGRIKASGATKLVTPCADCYGTFKAYFPIVGQELDVEILHTSEMYDRLIKEGRIKLKKEIPMKITYHDPCKLGRRGEPGIPWEGEYKRVEPHIFAPVPEKPVKLGLGGCYEPPRDVLKAIPGVELVEMERNRIHSWCCGAGGGAMEAFEDLSTWTALERIEEAKSTGAEVMVTACPWCERNFRDAIKEAGGGFEVFDVTEFVREAMGG
ncbi:MAG: (Fe-S)-binding protein [Actinobacteria bacterium]|nr:(Fe-S)-binding protein [Actinomycetota bacterium]